MKQKERKKMNRNQYIEEDDDDLEIPEIDSFPGSRRRKKEESLETTGADGIPFFLKGEDPRRKQKKTEAENDSVPSFLREEPHEDLKEEISSEERPDDDFPEKRRSVLRVIGILAVFAVLTAGLLFCGIRLVNRYMDQPAEAPITKAAVSSPSPSPVSTPSAVPAE